MTPATDAAGCLRALHKVVAAERATAIDFALDSIERRDSCLGAADE
jgi:hypothetical protein